MRGRHVSYGARGRRGQTNKQHINPINPRDFLHILNPNLRLDLHDHQQVRIGGGRVGGFGDVESEGREHRAVAAGAARWVFAIRDDTAGVVLRRTMCQLASE